MPLEIRQTDWEAPAARLSLMRFRNLPVILSMSADSYSLWVYRLNRLHGRCGFLLRHKQRYREKTFVFAGLLTFCRAWNSLIAAAVQEVGPLHDRLSLSEYKLKL